MEPHRSFGNRQHLLPYEQQICDAIGISKEEYFEYFELVQQYKAARSEEYELVPDIVNGDPGTIGLVLTVVGILFQVAGALLAPKPKGPQEQKRRPNFDGSNIRGRTRYAPLTNFDAIQDLAILGSAVPIIYADRRDGIGGVRVESQLLWSQLRNRHKHQELKVALLFGAGYIPMVPDKEGYAIGDSILQDYTNSKVRLIFKSGTNLQGPAKSNKGDYDSNYDYYSDGFNYDTFDAENDVLFKAYTPIERKYEWLHCTTRTSSTSASFGAYNPLPNSQPYRFQPEWPGKGDGEETGLAASIWAKRLKGYQGYMPYRCYLRTVDGYETINYVVNSKKQKQIYLGDKKGDKTPGRQMRFAFDPSNDYFLRNQGEDSYYAGEGEDSKWVVRAGGIDSGTQASDQARIDAADSMDLGELYLVGANIYRLKKVEPAARDPFDLEDRQTFSHYLTRIDENNFPGFQYKYVFNTSPTRLRRPDRCTPLQRVSIGTVTTTRAVDMVEIGIKSVVYNQVSGFPNVNSLDTDRVNDFAKDGATYSLGSVDIYTERLSFFRLQIRKVGDSTWDEPTGSTVFGIRGTNPREIYNGLRIGFYEKAEYEFRFIPICGNTVLNEQLDYWELYEGRAWREVASNSKYFIQAQRTKKTVTTKDVESTVYYSEMSSRILEDGDIPDYRRQDNDSNLSVNPHDIISDWPLFEAQSSSNQNEPEHTINFINEYIKQPEEFTEREDLMYSRLCYAGLALHSGKEWSDFSSFSAYFKGGVHVRPIRNATGTTEDEVIDSFREIDFGPTNSFADIVTDLLLRKDFGVGEYVGVEAVDMMSMRTASQFCYANKFTWDGVISDRSNIRDFIADNAGFALLDFTIIGGKFGLVPSVPYNSDKTVNPNAVPGDSTFEIRALFTDGNMRNFKVSFLPPEEREMFTAEILYRKETENGFPETEAVTVRLTNEQGGFFRDPVESFDCTQFMTSYEHAIRFAKYALLVRKHVDHSVTFETSPDGATSLYPGAYIYVASEISHYEPDGNNDWGKRFSVGCITPDGKVISGQEDIDGKKIYYWNSSLSEVQTTTIEVTDDYTVTDTALHGALFSVIPEVQEPRVYKVESLTINEDSMVEISATVVPLTSEGRMKVTQWSDQNFVIQGPDK